MKKKWACHCEAWQSRTSENMDRRASLAMTGGY
jgi:hypothetical protein